MTMGKQNQTVAGGERMMNGSKLYINHYMSVLTLHVEEMKLVTRKLAISDREFKELVHLFT